MIDADDELDGLMIGARGAVPRLWDLPSRRRRIIVSAGRNKIRELHDQGYADADEIAELTEIYLRSEFAAEDDPDVGNPFIIAILAALVQFLVKKLLERWFPDRRVEFVRYGK